MGSTDRRSFLARTLGAGALAAAAPGSLSATEATERVRAQPRAGGDPKDEVLHPRVSTRPRVPVPPDVVDEAYWEQVKAGFPLAPGLILMNAANLCPSPFEVQDAVFAWTRDVDRDPSFQNRAKFGGLLAGSRDAIARHFGALPEEIALTRNTSEGNNQVVTGLELGPGDEVLLWDQNHPTNSTSWEVRAEREGFGVVQVATPPAPTTPGALVDAFRAAMTERTRVLAFSHVSNASGVRLPAGELCRLARQRGIHAHVDGAQSGGALALDLHDMECDTYTCSSHKWMMGPKEAGVLYVRADVVDRLWAADVGVGWGSALEAGARKFETLGQRDDAAVSAMGTTAAMHERIGRAAIEARLLEITGALMEGLRERLGSRVSFHTPADPGLRAGVVVFGVDDVDGPELYRGLYGEHRVAGAGRGATFPGVRLSPHVYNTLADVERAVEAVMVEVG